MSTETVTNSAQEPAERVVEPLPADQIDHDDLYAALRRLTLAAGRVLADAERQSADLHKHLDLLAGAHQKAWDLLLPPPPPDTLEGAIALYPHALRPGDRVQRREGEWDEVAGLPGPSRTGRAVEVMLRHAGLLAFCPGELLVVVRPGGER